MEYPAFIKHFPAVDERAFAALDAVTIDLGREHLVTLADVLAGWSYDVARFGRELDTPSPLTDGVWHEYDYFASMLDRDRVETALALASDSTRATAHGLLDPIDARFEAITLPDTDGLFAPFARRQQPDCPGTGRWWGRIPVRGAVPAGLRAFASERP